MAESTPLGEAANIACPFVEPEGVPNEFVALDAEIIAAAGSPEPAADVAAMDVDINPLLLLPAPVRLEISKSALCLLEKCLRVHWGMGRISVVSYTSCP